MENIWVTDFAQPVLAWTFVLCLPLMIFVAGVLLLIVCMLACAMWEFVLEPLVWEIQWYAEKIMEKIGGKKNA